VHFVFVHSGWIRLFWYMFSRFHRVWAAEGISNEAWALCFSFWVIFFSRLGLGSCSLPSAMRPLFLSGSALLLGSLAAAAPHPPRGARYAANHHRANAAKEAFQVSWDGYYKYAFPHDSLRPVSNTYEDDRCVSKHGC